MKLLAMVWLDCHIADARFRGPMPYDEAMRLAKQLSERGCDTKVYKLTECAHYSRRPYREDAIKSG